MSHLKRGLSSLAIEAGFGTRAWSYYGYWATKYFYQIIGFFVTFILYFSLKPYTPWFIPSLVVAVYLAYYLVRHLVRGGWETVFYHPRTQFIRAQVGIVAVFGLMFWLRSTNAPLTLWVLYLLPLLIISRHCPTLVYLMTVLEVWGLLVVAGWTTGAGGSGYLLAALSLGLGLAAFLLHFLVRNIDARDDVMNSFEAIETLTNPGSYDTTPTKRWRNAMQTYLDIMRGSSAAVWLADYNTNRVRPLTNFNPHHSPAATIEDMANPNSIDFTANDPLAQVVRAGRPLYCHSDTAPPQKFMLKKPKTPTPTCPLPEDIASRIIVPIKDLAQPHHILGALSIDLTAKASPRPDVVADYFDFLDGLARRVRPIINHMHQIEELQALHYMGQQVSSNLNIETIAHNALEAIVEILGFEFATISLVDFSQDIIYTVLGRNVPQEWVKAARHSLDSDDIQADIVRSQKQEVLAGWDPRFDETIWQVHNHHHMVRVFTPIQGLDEKGQPLVRGTIEAGYHTTTLEDISDDQRRMLNNLARYLFIALENATLVEKIQRRAENLANLHRIGWEVALARKDLFAVLDDVADSIRRILNADIVMLYRYNRKAQELEMPRISGHIIGRQPLRPPSPNQGIVASILSARRSRYIPEVQKDPLLIFPDEALPAGEKHRTFTERQQIVSFAGVPMIASGEVMGVLCINYRSRHTFSNNHRRVLEIAAQFAAFALHNAETNDMMDELITSRERMQLAGQLHHSLSQYLPAIRLKAETAQVHLDGAHPQAAAALERIKEAALKASKETRVNLFELNAKSLAHADVPEILADYAREARGLFELDVNLSVKLNSVANLSPPVAREVLMICREGIANTAKHANATCLNFEIYLENGAVQIVIADNGCGFNPAQAKIGGRRGLTMLRRRLQKLNGHFQVNSREGQGTTLRAAVPLNLPPDKPRGLSLPK